MKLTIALLMVLATLVSEQDMLEPQFWVDEETNTSLIDEPHLAGYQVEFVPSEGTQQQVEQYATMPLLSGELEVVEMESISPRFVDFSEPAKADPVIAPATGGTPYEDLIITAEAKYKIREILRTMAENKVLKLLFERKRLEKLGDEIRFVHPIRFLGTVFSDPKMVGYMREIRKSKFKWNGFIDGFAERFKQEIKANNVLIYLPELAQLLGAEEAKLKNFVYSKDFKGLVTYLMNSSSF